MFLFVIITVFITFITYMFLLLPDTSRSQSLATARIRARNILYQPGDTKHFIRARVDAPPDIFLELFGHQSFSIIQKRTLDEAKL